MSEIIESNCGAFSVRSETIMHDGADTAGCDVLLPYATVHEHLLDELRWLNRIIAARVVRLRRNDFFNTIRSFRDFFIADNEIDELLAADVFGNRPDLEESSLILERSFADKADLLRAAIDRRLMERKPESTIPPLISLAKVFRLGAMERCILLICLAPHIDGRYEKLYAYLQDDIMKRAPGCDLLLGLLAADNHERFRVLSMLEDSSPLLRFRLIVPSTAEAGGGACQRFFRVEDAVRRYLFTGGMEPTGHLSPQSELSVDWKNLAIEQALRERLNKLFHRTLTDTIPDGRSLVFCGREGLGKTTIARALCAQYGRTLNEFDLHGLVRHDARDFTQIRCVIRDAVLGNHILYFDHIEVFLSAENQSAEMIRFIAQELQAAGQIALWGSTQPLSKEILDALNATVVEIPPPDSAAQRHIWIMNLSRIGLALDDQLIDDLVAHFDMSGGQIAGAVQMIVREIEPRTVPTADDFYRACRVQMQPSFGILARRVRPLRSWEEIVLPDDVMNQLTEICERVHFRTRVFSHWQFDQKLPRAKGVSALFAGPSGTGKTMAAEIIAGRLHYDLYRVDLAAVVSKYIGETEKNLDKIFTAAERSNCVLFFDEADALFGKRSEVRDSHDRYANVEISYLLQKMEDYQGVAILATNLRQNLDESFTRRLSFVVHFPFPDEMSRLAIWQKAWPRQFPLGPDVGLSLLAHHLKISGGSIANISLSAAFLAAGEQYVRMMHLVRAARREYQKMGKTLTEEEIAALVPSMESD